MNLLQKLLYQSKGARNHAQCPIDKKVGSFQIKCHSKCFQSDFLSFVKIVWDIKYTPKMWARHSIGSSQPLEEFCKSKNVEGFLKRAEETFI